MLELSPPELWLHTVPLLTLLIRHWVALRGLWCWIWYLDISCFISKPLPTSDSSTWLRCSFLIIPQFPSFTNFVLFHQIAACCWYSGMFWSWDCGTLHTSCLSATSSALPASIDGFYLVSFALSQQLFLSFFSRSRKAWLLLSQKKSLFIDAGEMGI